ncbi:histidine phosphatase family protein [Chloroflexota bacterium]
MARLLLVRHGNTRLNSTERFWGQTDVELGADGIKQAEKLRDRLAIEKIDTVYASPMSRTMATAEIITSQHKIKIIPCPELREINFGKIEGLTFKEIDRLYPHLTKSWYQRPSSFRYPGGESISEVNARAKDFLHRLKEDTPDETILIVAHSGTLKMLVCNLIGFGLRHSRRIRIDLASLSIVETFPQVAILNLLNDVSHLK